ncbi:unnamed protein product [Gordionus sp. m RMFG-2023]
MQTSEGKLIGTIVSVPGGDKLAVFMGVPYAKPPLGKLRFKPPMPMEPWGGERPATKLAPSCYQLDPLTQNISGNEDCLYLNVYAPRANTKEKLPVMVFIHGGYFLMGSGNNYPAYHLSARYNVIVVTVNYRLGILGFMRFSNLSLACANCGILDQIAALSWVRDNIPNIGGDPDKVTVFGQGSGGTCVKLLLTIPRARGLFDTAIAQGGSLASLEEVRNQRKFDSVEFVAREGQCPNIEDRNALLDCLRMMPAQKLLTISGTFFSIDNQDFLHHPFQPYIEEVTGKKAEGKHFEDIMHKIPFNSDTVLITGINSEEGLLPYFPPLLPKNSYNISEEGQIQVSHNSFENRIVPHVLDSQSYASNDDSMRKAAAFAYTPWSDPHNHTRIAESAIQITGDQLFTVPYLKDLKYLAKTHKKLYSYIFNYHSKTEDPPEMVKIPWFKNASSHGSELSYIFGFPTTGRSFLESTPHKAILNEMPGFDKKYNYALPDIGMSEFMMETWSNIAKRKRPHLKSTEWNRIRPNDMEHLVISDMGGTGPILSHNKGFKAMQSFFWDNFYPDLEKHIKEGELFATKNAYKESPKCATYRRATWGIVGMLSVIAAGIGLLALLRNLAKKRRKKFSSTPRQPNI